MKPLKKRREDCWSWQRLLRRERGWAAPQRRGDTLAPVWREAERQIEGRPATRCKKTPGKKKKKKQFLYYLILVIIKSLNLP